ncbi:MAG: efflux RND transporter periplasmic adaptor subunit [Gammaproteobacteria bacterium]|nr:efflux RND transporter periplasmic adaptor subunit [Gammaproteobacteria bacterium]
MRKLVVSVLLSSLCVSAAFAAPKSVQKLPPAMVNVTVAKKVNWQPKIEVTGSLAALQGVTIKAEVIGKITKIHADSGLDVKKGDLLFEIDPSVLQAQLKEARAAYALSEINYNRAAELYKKNAVSKASLDTLKEKMQSASANIEEITAELNQHIVEAPFDGKLGLSKVDLGDMVTEGEPLINLQQLNPLRVDFTVPEVYFGHINKGDKITFTSDSYPGQQFKGTVYATESVVDKNTRSLAVRASVPNDNNKLMPGMFVEVTLFLGKTEASVAVPQSAIVYSEAGTYVYKIVKGHAVKTKVTLGKRGTEGILIKQGVNAGDQVVSAGTNKVYEGAQVVAMNMIGNHHENH